MKTKEINPFLFYSKQLQQLFAKAALQKNPALWLYNNGVRTQLFMLEALTRLHNRAFDEKVFDKWNKRFKKLEDLFGEIDANIVFEKEFKENKNIPVDALKYFNVNSSEFIQKCNQRLVEKDWLNNKLEAFDSKLQEYKVDYNEDYIDELRFSMIDEIDAIIDFGLKYNFEFTKLEEHIHEIRRKIRWLSIYAQALQGLIQLKVTNKDLKSSINYFTKEVLNSPFNKLPAKPKNAVIIEFDKNSFFALSWLINELGILKDSGLKIHVLKNALYVSEKITEEQAQIKAIKLLGFKQTIESDILKQASSLIKTALLKDKILENLIIE